LNEEIIPPATYQFYIVLYVHVFACRHVCMRARERACTCACMHAREYACM